MQNREKSLNVSSFFPVMLACSALCKIRSSWVKYFCTF